MNVGIAGLDAVAHVNMARSDVTSSIIAKAGFCRSAKTCH